MTDKKPTADAPGPHVPAKPETLLQQAITKARIPVSRVLHIGANDGAEAQKYEDMGLEGWHIEALPDVHERLAAACAELPKQHSILACLDEQVHEVEFNIASNGAMSSSLFDWNTHPVVHPEVSFTGKAKLTTRRLDDLLADGTIPDNIDFAVLDVQGAELRVLKGGETFIRSPGLRGLIMEISHHELYRGCVLFQELVSHVLERGYYLKSVEFNQHGWADAVFLKRWWKEREGERPPIRRPGDARQSKPSTPS
ncbi:MAG: FkbM family methyltransferase [Paracoccaceae bacterium]